MIHRVDQHGHRSALERPDLGEGFPLQPHTVGWTPDASTAFIIFSNPRLACGMWWPLLVQVSSMPKDVFLRGEAVACDIVSEELGRRVDVGDTVGIEALCIHAVSLGSLVHLVMGAGVTGLVFPRLAAVGVGPGGVVDLGARAQPFDRETGAREALTSSGVAGLPRVQARLNSPQRHYACRCRGAALLAQTVGPAGGPPPHISRRK